ncbi:MAG: ATP-binding protein [Planctomycetota bacterium JB042]
MLERSLTPHAVDLARRFPAVAITGPRQSGKTTFAQSCFEHLPYVLLEDPTERAACQDDPHGFLARFPNGAVLDEIQNVPDLFSYLQGDIDRTKTAGRWILTGSTAMDLDRSISQSLAGRIATLELLPFARVELDGQPSRPATLTHSVLEGGYPPLFDPERNHEPVSWLDQYIRNFVRRDVRDLLDVRNRTAFDVFLRQCAARSGQVLDYSDLASTCGIDIKTAKEWISVLEACYVIHLLRPHYRNFGKRLTKRPKLYFVDTGLACRLLHLSDVNQLRGHPRWGALAETWCISEILKSRAHSAKSRNLWFWRTSDGHEVDVVIETTGGALFPIEITAAATPAPEKANGLAKLRELSLRDADARVLPGVVLYGGDEVRPVREDRFVPWDSIAETLEEVP